MRQILYAAAAAAVLCLPGAAGAETKTSALFSKSCDAKKIKELGGEAIANVEKMQPTTYKITLDEAKMKLVDLVKKMNEAGCFK